jgi:hypothetical protein
VVKCPNPVLQNGRLISGAGEIFSYQSTVMFECLQGFYMEGSSMVICSANNSWEPSIPKCLKGTKVVLFPFIFLVLFSLLVFKFISLMLNIMIPEKQ